MSEKEIQKEVPEDGEAATDREEGASTEKKNYFDHTYIRSIEGILRLISIVRTHLSQYCHNKPNIPYRQHVASL